MVAVIMRRNGSREEHSYLLGVWVDAEDALAKGKTECLRRGLKYNPEFHILSESGNVIKRWMGGKVTIEYRQEIEDVVKDISDFDLLTDEIQKKTLLKIINWVNKECEKFITEEKNVKITKR